MSGLQRQNLEDQHVERPLRNRKARGRDLPQSSMYPSVYGVIRRRSRPIGTAAISLMRILFQYGLRDGVITSPGWLWHEESARPGLGCDQSLKRLTSSVEALEWQAADSF